jgi:transposase
MDAGTQLASVRHRETLTMPAKKYIIDLTEAERNELLALTRKGSLPARKMKRAQILLKADTGASDAQIVAALDVSRPCVERVRQRFVAGGLPRALNEDPRPGQAPKLDGKQQARLVAEACSAPPAGHARWTLALLADRVVLLGFADRISRETVRRVLQKTTSSPGSSRNGAFPK